MDLLKQEDVRINRQVIAVGYGMQYEGDKRSFERPLKFTGMHIITMTSSDLNVTIFSNNEYAKICPGTSQ